MFDSLLWFYNIHTVIITYLTYFDIVQQNLSLFVDISLCIQNISSWLADLKQELLIGIQSCFKGKALQRNPEEIFPKEGLPPLVHSLPNYSQQNQGR